MLNSDTKYHEGIIKNVLSDDELENITDELLSDGIRLFEEAFDGLLNEIKNKITHHS